MAKNKLHTMEAAHERTLIVGVRLASERSALRMDDSLEELTLLARTAGLDVVGQASQQITTPNPKTLIGKGKGEEVNALAEELDADVILFDDELSPRHQRELEEPFGAKRRVG